MSIAEHPPYDPEALLDLLEDIVASYQDNDSRPVDALVLYRHRVKLGATYGGKLASASSSSKAAAAVLINQLSRRLRLANPALGW